MMFRSYEVECVNVSSICVREGVECVVLCVSVFVCGLDHSCVVLGCVSSICFVWGCCSYICAGGVSLSLVWCAPRPREHKSGAAGRRAPHPGRPGRRLAAGRSCP